MNQHILPQFDIFRHEVFGRVRTLHIKGDVWFFARDVVKALGYVSTSAAIKRHCRRAVKLTVENLNDLGYSLNVLPESLRFRIPPNIIPRGDVYRLIAGSRLETAKMFESWIFDELLPTLHDEGEYSLRKKEKSLPLSYENMLPEFIAAQGIAEFLGYKGNQAKLAAIKAMKNGYGIDTNALFPVPLLPSRTQAIRINPTEIGTRMNCSSRRANRILEAAGLQTLTRGTPMPTCPHGRVIWKLTDAGKKYGEYHDVGKQHNDGTPVQQIKWYDTVVPILQEKLDNGMEVKSESRGRRKNVLALVGNRHEKAVEKPKELPRGARLDKK